jgi:hypothetical protein
MPNEWISRSDDRKGNDWGADKLRGARADRK